MSINGSCWEYMLGVAEKIINSCADEQTMKKYYSLKERIIGKCILQSSSSIGVLSASGKQNSKYDASLRNSLTMSRSSSKFGKNQRTVRSKSRARELQCGRVQTYNSKRECQNQMENYCSQYSILNQLATILKNGQACPTVFKTVRFADKSYCQQLYKVTKTIQDSLKGVYRVLSKPIPSQQILPILQNSEKTRFNLEELLSDNKWLIQKMQKLIMENGTLRRMVGSRIY